MYKSAVLCILFGSAVGNNAYAARVAASPKPVATTVITYQSTSTSQIKTAETTLNDGANLKVVVDNLKGVTTTQTTADGTVQIKDSTGTTTIIPDGTKSVLDSTGTLTVNQPSGIVTTIAPTGATTIVDPVAGTTTAISENGVQTITEISTGTVIATESVTPPARPSAPSIEPVREVNPELVKQGVNTLSPSLVGQCSDVSASGC